MNSVDKVEMFKRFDAFSITADGIAMASSYNVPQLFFAGFNSGYTYANSKNLDKLKEPEGMVAQQADALKEIGGLNYEQGRYKLSKVVANAISATAEIVAKYKDELDESLMKEIELYQREVAAMIKYALPVLQEYASSNPKHLYHGDWQDPKGVHAALALFTNLQATAQAHDQKMKREGAVEVLEEVKQIANNARTAGIVWVRVDEIIDELRATSKKAGCGL